MKKYFLGIFILLFGCSEEKPLIGQKVFIEDTGGKLLGGINIYVKYAPVVSKDLDEIKIPDWKIKKIFNQTKDMQYTVAETLYSVSLDDIYKSKTTFLGTLIKEELISREFNRERFENYYEISVSDTYLRKKVNPSKYHQDAFTNDLITHKLVEGKYYVLCRDVTFEDNSSLVK